MRRHHGAHILNLEPALLEGIERCDRLEVFQIERLAKIRRFFQLCPLAFQAFLRLLDRIVPAVDTDCHLFFFQEIRHHRFRRFFSVLGYELLNQKFRHGVFHGKILRSIVLLRHRQMIFLPHDRAQNAVDKAL